MSFFGAVSQLGRLLPGYIEGERAAVKDNWQDLSNFNTTLRGQLQNAFDMSTWQAQLNDVYNRSRIQDDQSVQSFTNLIQNLAGFPSAVAGNAAISPEQTAALMQARYNATLNNLQNQGVMQGLSQQLYNMLLNPGTPTQIPSSTNRQIQFFGTP